MTITNGGTFSPNQSYKSNYVVTDHYIQNVTTLNAFRDELIDTRKVKNVTTVAQIETDTVNIFPTSTSITINNNALPAFGDYIIYVNGNVTINGAAAPLIFNQSSYSIAIIATGTIFIDESITEANGIFIAPQVVLSSTAATADQQPPLKINGNIISTNAVDTSQRQSANQNSPSFFVVFRPKMYFDLLPLLSTVVQEGRQLE
jgi:hypothetical protein